MKIQIWLMPALMLSAAQAKAQEQRCKDLGADCVCSEPLQMTALNPVNVSWHDPNDSSVKQCNGEAVGGQNNGGAITRNASDLQPSSDPGILGALPSGNSVARFLKAPEGVSGILQLGHQLQAGDPHARVAIRYYLYFSPNFDFKFERDGSLSFWNSSAQDSAAFNQVCQNTKWGEINDTPQGIHWDISTSPAIYGFAANWTPAADCCWSGPLDGHPNNVATGSWKGKWWLIEMAIGNATGSSGVYFQAWRKNVTDNLPEEKLIDSRLPCPGCGGGPGWTTEAATALTPYNNTRLDTLFANQYRQNGANYGCKGFYAWSHFMKAAWSSDAGQRIGPAYEIEGGGTTVDATAPGRPKGLRLL